MLAKLFTILILFMCLLLPVASFAESSVNDLNKRLGNFETERDNIVLEFFGLNDALKAHKSGRAWDEVEPLALRDLALPLKGKVKFDFKRFDEDLSKFLKTANPEDSQQESQERFKRVSETEKANYRLGTLESIREMSKMVFAPTGQPNKILARHRIGDLKQFAPAVEYFKNQNPKLDVKNVTLIVYRPQTPNLRFAEFMGPGPDPLVFPAHLSSPSQQGKGKMSFIASFGTNRLTATLNKHFLGAESVILIQEALFESDREELLLGVITEELSHYYDYVNEPDTFSVIKQMQERAELAKQYQKEERALQGELLKFFESEEYVAWRKENTEIAIEFAQKLGGIKEVGQALDRQYALWAIKTFRSKYFYYHSALEKRAKTHSCAVLHKRFGLTGDKIIDTLFVEPNELVTLPKDEKNNEGLPQLTPFPQPPFMQKYFVSLLKGAGIEKEN